MLQLTFWCGRNLNKIPFFHALYPEFVTQKKKRNFYAAGSFSTFRLDKGMIMPTGCPYEQK